VDSFMLRAFVLAARADARADAKSDDFFRGHGNARPPAASVVAALSLRTTARERPRLAPRAALPAALIVIAFILHGASAALKTVAVDEDDNGSDNYVNEGSTDERAARRRQRKRDQQQQQLEGDSREEGSEAMLPRALLKALGAYWEAAEANCCEGLRARDVGDSAVTQVEAHADAAPATAEEEELKEEGTGSRLGGTRRSADAKREVSGTETCVAASGAASGVASVGDGDNGNVEVHDANGGASAATERKSTEEIEVDEELLQEQQEQEQQQEQQHQQQPQSPVEVASIEAIVPTEQAYQRGPLPLILEGNEVNEEDRDGDGARAERRVSEEMHSLVSAYMPKVEAEAEAQVTAPKGDEAQTRAAPGQVP
jgi:hypothetical protein